jgi:hypothetical protein
MRARIRIVAEAPDNVHLGHGSLIRPRIRQGVDEKCSKVRLFATETERMPD